MIKRSKKASAQETTNTQINSLTNAIRAIYNKTAISLSFEELYRCAYSVILSRAGSTLYQHTTATITDLLVDLSRPGLHGVDQVWSHHLTCMLMLRDVLMYMDRLYKPTCDDALLVYDLGIEIFRDVVVLPNKQSITNEFIENVKKDRDNVLVDASFLKRLVNIFCAVDEPKKVGMSVYLSTLEPAILQDATTYYKDLASRIKEFSVPKYLELIETSLLNEKNRVLNYLLDPTEERIVKVILQEMVTNQLETILNVYEINLDGKRSCINDNKRKVPRFKTLVQNPR